MPAGAVQVVDPRVAQRQVVHARRRRHVLRRALRPFYASRAAAAPTARLHGRLPRAAGSALARDHSDEALAALQRHRLVGRRLGVHHAVQPLCRTLQRLYASRARAAPTALRDHRRPLARLQARTVYLARLRLSARSCAHHIGWGLGPSFSTAAQQAICTSRPLLAPTARRADVVPGAVRLAGSPRRAAHSRGTLHLRLAQRGCGGPAQVPAGGRGALQVHCVSSSAAALTARAHRRRPGGVDAAEAGDGARLAGRARGRGNGVGGSLGEGDALHGLRRTAPGN